VCKRRQVSRRKEEKEKEWETRPFDLFLYLTIACCFGKGGGKGGRGNFQGGRGGKFYQHRIVDTLPGEKGRDWEGKKGGKKGGGFSGLVRPFGPRRRLPKKGKNGEKAFGKKREEGLLHRLFAA